MVIQTRHVTCNSLWWRMEYYPIVLFYILGQNMIIFSDFHFLTKNEFERKIEKNWGGCNIFNPLTQKLYKRFVVTYLPHVMDKTLHEIIINKHKKIDRMNDSVFFSNSLLQRLCTSCKNANFPYPLYIGKKTSTFCVMYDDVHKIICKSVAVKTTPKWSVWKKSKIGEYGVEGEYKLFVSFT